MLPFTRSSCSPGAAETPSLAFAGRSTLLASLDEDVDSVGVPPSRLLKTLMAKAGGQVVCVLIASDKEVSLKKLASAAGTKDAAIGTKNKVGHGLSAIGNKVEGKSKKDTNNTDNTQNPK